MRAEIEGILERHALFRRLSKLERGRLAEIGDTASGSQRARLAEPDDPQWWARHRLAFMVQSAYSGAITR